MEFTYEIRYKASSPRNFIEIGDETMDLQTSKLNPSIFCDSSDVDMEIKIFERSNHGIYLWKFYQGILTWQCKYPPIFAINGVVHIDRKFFKDRDPNLKTKQSIVKRHVNLRQYKELTPMIFFFYG